VFDIDRLTFVDPREYARIVDETGRELPIYTNVSAMESELLKRAPEDAMAIHELATTVRRLARLRIPDDFWPLSWGAMLRILPALPLLRRLSRCSIEEYGKRFRDPLIKSFFGAGNTSTMSALALLLSLAWLSQRNAGYPIGGSHSVIHLIEENLARLDGELRLGAKVNRILVENDAAVGVELEGGVTVTADWVISAADGHATIYDWLGGQYTDEGINRAYQTLRPFPSYLQVSFGIARNLSQEAPFLTRLLKEPLHVDPGTELDRLSFRIFHFDPTFAPPGKTAVTAFLPTRSFGFWVDLKANDPARYMLEKRRIAEAVTTILEQSLPQVRQAVEVTDVSTPATVIAHTGNWQGSMEGWLMTPRAGIKPLRRTLPGLRQFLMIGQWVQPGGGLPSGLITARAALRAVCKHDHVPFVTAATPAAKYSEIA
jgi:phytoene dehydrogenase-like protein